MYPSRPPFREKFVMKKKKEEEIDRVVYEEYRVEEAKSQQEENRTEQYGLVWPTSSCAVSQRREHHRLIGKIDGLFHP